MYLVFKTLLTALIIVAISETAKRYSFVAAVIASLPLTSILAFIWLYHDTGDSEKIMALSYEICWLVLPSILFFIALPFLLKTGMKFYPALFLSCAIMAVGYAAFTWLKDYWVR